jgi:hypothetical protein
MLPSRSCCVVPVTALSPVKLLRGRELPNELLLPLAPALLPIGGGGVNGKSSVRLAELENRQRERFFSLSGGLTAAFALVGPVLSSVSNSEWSVTDDFEWIEAAGERVGWRCEPCGFSADPGIVGAVGVSTGVAEVF